MLYFLGNWSGEWVISHKMSGGVSTFCASPPTHNYLVMDSKPATQAKKQTQTQAQKHECYYKSVLTPIRTYIITVNFRQEAGGEDYLCVNIVSSINIDKNLPLFM